MAASNSPDSIARLAEVWAEALADLGVGGLVRRVDDAVLIPCFGGAGGMLCLLGDVGDRQPAVEERARGLEAGWSFLGDSYLTYDRSLFTDTLDDWGWTGDGAPPDWYSGAP